VAQAGGQAPRSRAGRGRLIALFGVALAGGGIALAVAGRSAPSTVLGPASALLVLGALAWLSGRIRAGGDAPEPTFGGGGSRTYLGYFAVALLAGEAAVLAPIAAKGIGGLTGGAAAPLMALATATIATLPLWHAVAGTAPALAIVARLAKRQSGMRLRTLLRGLAWGGLGAAGIAMFLEILFVVAIAAVLVALLLADPAGRALIDAVIAGVGSPDGLDPEAIDMDAIAPLITHPGVLGAAFLMFAVLGPAAEETAKAFGISLIRSRTRPRAFLAGAACGAGFGITESLLIGAVSAGPMWGVVMLVRATSTLMHTAMGALGGLGWFALREGRTGAGVLRIGAAIGLHGMWNGLVLAAALGGLISGAGLAGDGLAGTAAGIAAAIGPLALTLLLGSLLIGLLAAGDRAGREWAATAAAVAASGAVGEAGAVPALSAIEPRDVGTTGEPHEPRDLGDASAAGEPHEPRDLGDASGPNEPRRPGQPGDVPEPDEPDGTGTTAAPR